jgi:hypothetical protein
MDLLIAGTIHVELFTQFGARPKDASRYSIEFLDSDAAMTLQFIDECSHPSTPRAWLLVGKHSIWSGYRISCSGALSLAICRNYESTGS